MLDYFFGGSVKKRLCLFIALMTLLSGCSFQEKTQEDIKTKEVTFAEDNCYKYHYQQLNKKQKKLYQELFHMFVNIETEGKISDKNMKDVDLVHNAILNDHPELFYIETEIVYSDYRVEVEYTFKKSKIKKYKKEIEHEKDIILQDLPKGDQYEKMLYLYNYVVSHLQYNENAKYNQTLISSIINKETVCTGYAKMIQYLYQEIGIETTQITGTCVDENNLVQRHAWNMVKYQDDYYYIDATWADREADLMILYEYFIFSSQDMLKIYTPEDHYENTVNDQYNYFVHNHLYYTEYDQSSLVQGVDKEKKVFTARFSDDIYEYVKTRVKETNDPFDILSKAGIHVENIHYWYDDHFNVITITW